jgi:transcriptional regulator of met regulon
MKFATIALCAFAVVSAAHAADPAPTAKDLRRYYSANLPEAKKVMQECVAKGFDSLQAEERMRCEAARDAWHFQPYKPSKK